MAYVIKRYLNDFGRVIEQRTWKPYVRKLPFLGWVVYKSKNDMILLAVGFGWENTIKIALDAPFKEFVDPEWDIRL
jgi:hypothetical protein